MIPEKDKIQRKIAVGLVFILLISVFETGCGPTWRDKFIRKDKRGAKTDQPVLTLESDEKALFPPAIRYQQHFAYWKSWHSELLDSLGQTRKRDIRYLAGAIGELRGMAEVLSGPPSDRLRALLEELNNFQAEWERNPAVSIPVQTRIRLEWLQREIDRKLHYSKVKTWIIEKVPSPQETAPKA